MKHTRAPRRRSDASRNVFHRQMIVCAVALVIVTVGIWVLWNGQAPYHPESYSADTAPGEERVTRGSIGLLSPQGVD